MTDVRYKNVEVHTGATVDRQVAITLSLPDFSTGALTIYLSPEQARDLRAGLLEAIRELGVGSAS